MNLSAAARDATLRGRPKTDCLREVDVEPTGARRGLQGADVHAQLAGEFAQAEGGAFDAHVQWWLSVRAEGRGREPVEGRCPTCETY